MVSYQCDLIYTTPRIKRKLHLYFSFPRQFAGHPRFVHIGETENAEVQQRFYPATRCFLSLLGEISRPAHSHGSFANQFSRRWPRQKGRWIGFCRAARISLRCTSVGWTRIGNASKHRRRGRRKPHQFPLFVNGAIRGEVTIGWVAVQIDPRLPRRWKLHHVWRSETDLVDASTRRASGAPPIVSAEWCV